MESRVDPEAKGQTQVVLLGHEDRELVLSLDGWKLIELVATKDGMAAVYEKRE